jgi:hypothetical protein
VNWVLEPLLLGFVFHSQCNCEAGLRGTVPDIVAWHGCSMTRSSDGICSSSGSTCGAVLAIYINQIIQQVSSLQRGLHFHKGVKEQ